MVSHFVSIDAYTEVCFPAGTKMGLIFEVVEGGFLNIDVEIVRPDNQVIYKVERESNENYTFTAYVNGTSTFCFSNKIGVTLIPKIVNFTIDIGKAPQGQDTETEGEESFWKGNRFVLLARQFKTPARDCRIPRPIQSIELAG